MQFIYPQSILNPRLLDEIFREEAEAMRAAGHAISLIDGECLADGIAKIKPSLDAGTEAVYRGWMLTPIEYEHLIGSVEMLGGRPFTTKEQYLSTHYLPHWYEKLSDLTPETVVLPVDADMPQALAALGWTRFFVKDFVKSLKTSIGSIIERPEDIHHLVAEMEMYRGQIEGGLCIRQVEDFIAATEQRYFIVNGKPFSSDVEQPIPNIVFECGDRIRGRFFSVDVVTRSDGQLRVVEIGDGQVSDLVGWPVGRFVAIWQDMI
jgi:hypothetical protein